MGRRALSIAAITLWLGAGAAFAIFGIRALRLEREAAQEGAKRWAIAALDDATRLLPTVVSDLLEKKPIERFALERGAPVGPRGPQPAPSAEDVLTLDQAAYLERAGRTAEAEHLLERLTSRQTDDPAVLTASLRVGALARARNDHVAAEPLLQRAALAGPFALDPEGRQIGSAARRLLVPIEAGRGTTQALTELLAAAGDGSRLRMDGSPDAADFLAAAAADLHGVTPGPDPALRLRLDDAVRRARRGHELLRATSERGVVVLGDQIAYRPVSGIEASIVTTSLTQVAASLDARIGGRVALLDHAPENMLVARAAPPFASIWIAYPNWPLDVRTPPGAVTIWALGLGLYLVAGLAAILWFVRSARTSRMQADFVAAVSHEMKTPIAGIQAMAEMLADGRVPDPARAHAYAERIRAEASRLGAGVRNVLDAARIERDPSSVVHPVPVEPSVLVEDLASVMRPVLEGRGFRFTVKTAPSRHPIPIDPDSFGSVVGNLLDNAAKFSTETKEIDVEAGPVADRGPGIPRDERAKIFDRFERGEHARRMAVPGVGLGLHVATNLMKAHGGTITVADREGGGAVFMVEWPEGTA